ncbi:MAG: hypothetical protein Q8Q11_01055 [bacterium]|nr:hypothetical protein [bacterium]MDZ4247922.1 hypothetical protein [Patescibacteria group bacterium]
MSAITAMILIVVLVIVLGLLLMLQRHRTLPKTLSAEDKSLAHVRWHEVREQLKRGGPAHLRQSVITADNLVDHCLKALGIPGDTMGERLKAAGRARFSDYDGLWSAHKTRNRIVHEADKELLSFETKSALDKFERALKDLGAL